MRAWADIDQKVVRARSARICPQVGLCDEAESQRTRNGLREGKRERKRERGRERKIGSIGLQILMNSWGFVEVLAVKTNQGNLGFNSCTREAKTGQEEQI